MSAARSRTSSRGYRPGAENGSRATGALTRIMGALTSGPADIETSTGSERPLGVDAEREACV